MLRSAASALLAQGALHSELMQLEWAEEKYRLLRMLVTLLAGSLFLFFGLFSLSAMVLIFSWGTPYQTAALLGLVLFYCTGTGVAWFRFNALFALGSQAFAGTRAELAADIALIRSKLDSPR
jgi:uncharacterized membrane protein YqjE